MSSFEEYLKYRPLFETNHIEKGLFSEYVEAKDTDLNEFLGLGNLLNRFLGRKQQQVVPAKPAPRYTDKPAEDLEVIEQPVKMIPEKVMQFIKSSGVDVTKISPKEFQDLLTKLHQNKTRAAAVDQLRNEIRIMLAKQGKGNPTGAIA